MKKKMHAYLKFLGSGDYKKLLTLFNKDASIYSPLYGEMPAADFYKALFSDTQTSEIRLIDIYFNKKNNKASCHFEYKWTLASGKEAAFECVDLFEFGDNGKIDQLKIIYDTVKTRAVWQQADKP